MNAALVSVVIPAYNAARTLKAAVQSVLDQTVQDFEVIIVNDGSKDNTLEVAQLIADSDLRVKVISQPNGGASAARNTGIKAAKGEYVAFLDADDLWLPHKLERQLEVLTNEKDVNAIQCGVYYVNNDLEVISVNECFESKDTLLETLLFQNMPAMPSTVVVKRSMFDEIGYLDTKLVILEDWELMIRLARFCHLKSIEEPLSLYRVHDGNRSKDLSIHIEPGFIILERLFSDPSLPVHIKKRKKLIYSTFYTMLCGGAFNSGRYGESFKWGAKAVATHPRAVIHMISLPVRKFQRMISRRRVIPAFKTAVNKLESSE